MSFHANPKASAPSFASAPPISENVSCNFNDDLMMLNRKRFLRVSEIIKELKQAVVVYNKKSLKRKNSEIATSLVKTFCNLCTVPSIGLTLLFPFVSFVSVPVALAGTAAFSICDVHQTRTVSKRRRSERIYTAARCCHDHIEELLKNVLMDGIVTEQEFQLVSKYYDAFRDTLKLA